MMQRYIFPIAAGAVALGSLGLGSLLARAQAVPYSPTSTVGTATSSTSTPITAGPAIALVGPVPAVVRIDASGRALVRGVVTSVSPSALTLRSWGGTWTVQTMPNMTLIPGNGTSTNEFFGIQIGDFVGVAGTVSQADSLTVLPTVVHDWTQGPPITTAAGSSSTSTSSSAGGVTTSSGTPSTLR